MFKDMTGQKVPSVTFPIRADDNWAQRDSNEIFSGKTECQSV